MLYKLLLLINLFNITSACLPSATNDEGTVPITESLGSGTTDASFGIATASSGITSAVATTTTTSNPFAGCKFNNLTNAQRDLVVQIHNNFRSMLANGEDSGNLSPGKNIYKLKYNCDLENSAQVTANNCTFGGFDGDLGNCIGNTCSSQHTFGSTGENQYKSNAIESNALQSSISAWWDQLRTNGRFNKTNPVYSAGFFLFPFSGFERPTGSFAQVAWADTLTVGCGVGHCSANPTFVVCHYAKGGSIEGEKIYQVGAPCSGCTTFAGSTCDSTLGLCVAPDANYQNPF